jgi:WD40 repeat protein
MNPSRSTGVSPSHPAQPSSSKAPWLLAGAVLILLAGVGAVVAGALLAGGAPAPAPDARGPGQEEGGRGGAPRQETPFKGEIPVGAKARPVAGDALAKPGQHLLAEPRPPVEESGLLGGIFFSPDGTLLGTGGPGHEVTLRDAATGARKAALSVSPKDRIERAAISPDGRLLAASLFLREAVHIWDVRTGKHRRTLKVQAADLAFTPDGSRLVTSESRGPVKLWDVSKGTVERELSGKADRSRPFVVISPDGKWLALATEDGKAVMVLDPATGKVRHRLDDGKGALETCAFSPDSKALAVSGYLGASRLVLYDLDSGKPRWSFAQKDGWFTRLAFSPSGKTLAAGRDNGGGIDLHDPRTGSPTLHLHGVRMTVAGLAWSPDGRFLAAVDNYEPRMHSWEILPSEQEGTITTAAKLNRVAAGRSGKLLAAGTWKGIELHDLTSAKKKPRTLAADQDWRRLALAPDEKSLLGLAIFRSGVFDLATGKMTALDDPPGNPVPAYTPDGRLVLAGTGGLSVRKGNEELRHVYKVLHSLALSPDGKLAAAGDDRGKVHVYETATGKRRTVLDAHEGTVRALAFSPDGQRLATGGAHKVDQTVRLWQVATGKEIATLTGHAGNVTGLVFSPDGKHLVSGGLDGRLLVWDLAKRRPVRSLRAHVREVSQVAPVGAKRFASVEAELQRVLLWDWAKATAPDPELRLPARPEPPPQAFLTRIRSLGKSPGFLLSTTVSPDERWLVWADDKAIHVRDLKTGKDRFVLKGHADHPGLFRFSPDGEHLVSAGRKTIRWWSLRTGKEVKKWRPVQEALRDLAWADGGKTLVSVAFVFWNQETLFWDVAKGKAEKNLEVEKHLSGPESVTVSPDGRHIAVAGTSVILLDARTRKVVRTLRPAQVGRVLAFSPDSKLIAVAGHKVSSDTLISVLEVDSGRLLHTLKGYGDPIWEVAFTRGGRDLLAFGRLPTGEPCLRLWDVKTGAERLRMPWLRGTDLPRDGKRLITSKDREGVWVWNFEDVYDAPLQAALAPLVPLGADGEVRDGKLWLTLNVQGRDSRKALGQLAKVPRTLGLKLLGGEDDDMASLKNARNVKGLDLSAALLRDEALKHLQTMTWLESLTLPRFGFSEEAVQGLKKALPGTKVRTAE